MSQDEKEDEKELEDEREKLKDLGIDSTWNILSSGEKKKRELEEKKAFRGFN